MEKKNLDLRRYIDKIDNNWILIALCVIAVQTIVWMFTGNHPFARNPYNTYVLQAEAWVRGQLSLGRDYPHLELAIVNNDYYVSFPPFPSMVYFPILLLRLPLYDGVIALISAVIGAVLCYQIFLGAGCSKNNALLFSLLFTIGSNMLFVSVNAWVWFIAQNMCFTLTVAAIYCAMKKRGVLSFLFWACAIGCRPFSVLYLPVLCMLLMRAYDEGIGLFFRRTYMFAGAVLLAMLYMWLNYARFGNIIEFGHNYLPEFTRTATGQFHLSYIKDNLYKLIRLPGIKENGSIAIQTIDGTNMFLASPVFLVVLYYLFKDIKRDTAVKITAFVLLLVELLCITAHKTMGGWGFGNRYTNDTLPFALVILALSYKNQKVSKPMILLAIYSIAFNIVGTILLYMKVL